MRIGQPPGRDVTSEGIHLLAKGDPEHRWAVGSEIQFSQDTAQIQFRLASRLQTAVKQQRGPSFGLAVAKTFTE